MGWLRTALDRREASHIHVSGMRGVGKTTLITRISADYRTLHHRCAPLADAAQRERLARALGDQAGAREGQPDSWAEGQVNGWDHVMGRALEIATPGGSPFVLVLDDAYRLAQGRSRMADVVAATVARARAEDRPLHVVTVSHEASPFTSKSARLHTHDTLHVAPLPFRAALPLLPGVSPRDLMRSYATFGGIPRVLRTLDQSVTLSTNLRNLLLEPDAPLADAGPGWIERDVQNPTRYYAVLSALSRGEADWATIHAGVPGLTASGQVAPYLQRLEELGLIGVRRSLDAGPHSRSRRYRVADPFLAFWYRFVLPRKYGEEVDPTSYLNEHIRPHRDHHTQNIFAEICRQFMAYDGVGHFGSNARESGSLWGADTDIASAGILASGAAFYGMCHWDEVTGSATPLADLDRAVGETRYGFGREHRLRILFSARPLPRAIEREVARRHEASVIGPEVLAGMEEE
jgi:uncharacterized protein